jgi:hypothetical protein
MAKHDEAPRRRRRLAVLVAAVLWAMSAAPAVGVARAGTGSGVERTDAVSIMSESDDIAQLIEELRSAIDAGLETRLIVLSSPVDDLEGLAASLAAEFQEPVIVVGPDGSTAAADTPGRTTTAATPGTLVRSPIANGLATFMAQSNPSGMSWGITILIPALAVALLAAVRRTGEYRAMRISGAATLQARWAWLEDRADALADPVLELSTRVELDGRTEAARAYRGAASEYGRLRDALAEAASEAAAEGIGRSLDDLERRFDQIETMLADR